MGPPQQPPSRQHGGGWGRPRQERREGAKAPGDDNPPPAPRPRQVPGHRPQLTLAYISRSSGEVLTWGGGTGGRGGVKAGLALRTARRSSARSSALSGTAVKSPCSCSPSCAICFRHLQGTHTRLTAPVPGEPQGSQPPAQPGHPTPIHPPSDGTSILVQAPHALQGSRVGLQVRGEAGVFQHEEHVRQLFEGALGEPSGVRACGGAGCGQKGGPSSAHSAPCCPPTPLPSFPATGPPSTQASPLTSPVVSPPAHWWLRRDATDPSRERHSQHPAMCPAPCLTGAATPDHVPATGS